MEKQIHTRDDGTTGKCRVTTGVCPYNKYGHHDTHAEARLAYESTRQTFSGLSHKKRSISSLVRAGQQKMAERGWTPVRLRRAILNSVVATAFTFSAAACAGDNYQPWVDEEEVIGSTVVQTYQETTPAPPKSTDVDFKKKAKETIDSVEEKWKSPENQERLKEWEKKLKEIKDSASKEFQDRKSETPRTSNTSKEYSRSSFKHWTDTNLYANTCDTRQDILQRDMKNMTFEKDGCTVKTGTLQDPFTGKTLKYVRGNSNVDIDHIVPLKAGWDSGAFAWSDAKREEFANDPLNLWAVSASANRAKGAQTPATWMPINKDKACEYGLAFLKVSEKYDLKIDKKDVASVDAACQ